MSGADFRRAGTYHDPPVATVTTGTDRDDLFRRVSLLQEGFDLAINRRTA